MPRTTPIVQAIREHKVRTAADMHDVLTGPVFVNTAAAWLSKPNVTNRSFKPMLIRAGYTGAR